ncbi:MAG: hypothetical protein AAB651_01445 [Patescibacteria group bacterium]
MSKIIELKIKNDKNIYHELSRILSPHRENPIGSILFIIEGTKKKPVIGIRYPGKKLKRRLLKKPNKNSALWANLYDFEVVPFKNGKEINTQKFTFDELMKDFQQHKMESEAFWKILKGLYEKNIISGKIPKLAGINPLLYLRVLKWIWIQEDFNYRFKWSEVGSPVPYVLETRTGTRTSGGAGRAKFFAALVLLKNNFTFDQVKKIIPLY